MGMTQTSKSNAIKIGIHFVVENQKIVMKAVENKS
jgi:hypothetical protein